MYDVKSLKVICSELTILLVDDEEAARTQVYNILLLLFKKVLVAVNGEEALQIYKEQNVDIIITDLTMPKMDGFGLIEAIRSIRSRQKIIIMSAHTETDIIVKSIKSGVDGYILKPIEATQMFEAIEKSVHFLNLEKENKSYQDDLENKINKQAQLLVKQFETDSLTGLPNKEKLCLDFTNKENKFNEVILLNIDNFAQINATYGHSDGDRALSEISLFLKEIVKEHLYRGNGDEFIILLESSTPAESLALANRIKEKIYTKRFTITATAIRITFTMGIVTITEDEKELPYAKAQLALSDIRRLHKNSIGHYEKSSQTQEYQQEMHEWAYKVKLALDFDLLVPYYQPIVNVKTGEIEKYECLARIVEEGNPISPFRFIEPARIAGMVTDITRRMIIKSFATFSNSNMEFSINITDDDFKEDYLIEYLEENCQIYNIKPTQVILEVLENISDYDATHAISQMDRLKSIGYSISIDDFGAESSNFARVQKLQVDYIKIDGAFVKDIAQNQNSLIITKTIIFYAKNMGIKTVAEFVHDEETYEIVKELDVDYVQGYYLSEPLKEVR